MFEDADVKDERECVPVSVDEKGNDGDDDGESYDDTGGSMRPMREKAKDKCQLSYSASVGALLMVFSLPAST